ncbi:PH (Pleckstrin Homology) domain-containing protein [Saccharopolyspora erythraea NRRL 2338]|uniref:Membrane-flanked domain protein n=2 Tax=Saccharopolyspora erythraea TaxID=1836 RepID=A4FNP4_SACEN|nr:PH domain-containing protein [Saccharopolyspora erythraea]PFG99307.1 PH (Pleckstrin Homology) domain-containing protein [Saccharopolyspora erythraea NRRL 2338]QRK89241.1 PH domain-containing protein [Saccharopolyspora erythraea]CAM05669.1 membrane-flanked domain protein [Saccharopolyspora erythraea NRRL 2338]
MAYPDALLGEHEHVVVHKHPHWKMLVLPVLALLVVVGGGSYLAALAAPLSWHLPVWVVLAVVAAIMVVWFTVAPLLRWRTTHFVITTHRLMVREGVFTRSGVDIPLGRISSVRFRHGLLDRMVGCGTLVVESASDEPLEFDDIPAVEKVHTLLHREISQPDQEDA